MSEGEKWPADMTDHDTKDRIGDFLAAIPPEVAGELTPRLYVEFDSDPPLTRGTMFGPYLNAVIEDGRVNVTGLGSPRVGGDGVVVGEGLREELAVTTCLAVMEGGRWRVNDGTDTGEVYDVVMFHTSPHPGGQ